LLTSQKTTDLAIKISNKLSGAAVKEPRFSDFRHFLVIERNRLLYDTLTLLTKQKAGKTW